MELINADTIRSVRTPEAATTAPVHVATDLKEWDVLVSVCASFMPLISCHPLIKHKLNTIQYFMTFKVLHLQLSDRRCFHLLVCNSIKLRIFCQIIQHVKQIKNVKHFCTAFPSCFLSACLLPDSACSGVSDSLLFKV